MQFTVIDFETANSQRGSACALGLTVVEKGEIVSKNAWLIRPKENRFSGMNIAIHGIRPADVENEPEFDELYNREIKDYLEGALVVAHNASFDISVLRHVLDQYAITYPRFDYLCTVKLAQKHWDDLPNHKLNTLSEYLNFSFKHHDALDDTLACANVLMRISKERRIKCAKALAKDLGVRIGTLYPGGYKSCSARRK